MIPDHWFREFVLHVVYGLAETSLISLILYLVRALSVGPDGPSIFRRPTQLLLVVEKITELNIPISQSMLRKVDRIAKKTGLSRALVAKKLLYKSLKK